MLNAALNPTKDFNSGTSEAAFPFCSTTNRIALSHLLSRYQATVAGTDGKTTFELKQGFYPIALEIAKTVADAPTPSGTAQKPAQNDSNGTPPPESGTNMPPPSTDPSTYAPDTGRGGDNYQPDVPGTSNTPSTPPAGEGGGAGTNNRGSAPAQPQDE